MGNDEPISNIIKLSDGRRNLDENTLMVADGDDANAFIIDMLDRLMRIATKEDQSVLVYLLAMARIEAIESTNAK
ncbi:MAG: hypothetical protein GY927_21125 [bacterium]|nr:hypothetical protein [bacterium]